MPRVDPASQRKARGAFFTPPPLAQFVADWAVRSAHDAVLEPSCGEAVFLHQVGRRGHTGHLVGVDVHADSVTRARSSLETADITATIRTADFFGIEPEPTYDAVVGNPPYIRYQDFTGEARARARTAALRAGVPLSGLASSWAAFTVHAALFLRPGGRLGLVLPAELLSVNYAAGVRRFLMERFATVRLVLFTERVFPGVLEEVLLLLADGYSPDGRGGTDHCEVFQVRGADSLADLAKGHSWRPSSPSVKWTPATLAGPALAAYADVTDGVGFGVLEDWGDTTLGMVTGNNSYFALSPERVALLGLRATDLLPLSPPGSRHLRELALTGPMLADLAARGKATWLFRPAGEPSAAARGYLAAGESAGVPLAYKCRVRSPWWRVPYQPPADLLLTYMNADTPRLTTNRARAHHLNSVHGVYLRPEHRRVGRDLLALASLNSVTLLGAEVVGRAYGGGLLKLEPREADTLPLPRPEVVAALRDPLRRVRRAVTARLATGRLLAAVTLVDEVLMEADCGLDGERLATIRAAHGELTARRVARGRLRRG